MSENSDIREWRLHLDGFCIQTAAKSRLRELTRRVLEDDSSADPDLGRELEDLEAFLNRTDFSRLRAEMPILDGRSNLHVILRCDPEGFIVQVEE